MLDAAAKRLTVNIDFVAGGRVPHPEIAGGHPVHNTVVKCYRHLNFFQHDCCLEEHTPRIKLPDGRVALIEPEWAGQVKGFTLLLEAMVLMLAQPMSFTAIDRTVDETPYQRVHNYLTLVTDALERKVVFVTEGKDAATIEAFVESLRGHGGEPAQIALTCRRRSSKASRRTCRMLAHHLRQVPRLVAYASKAVGPMRRPSSELIRNSRDCDGRC